MPWTSHLAGRLKDRPPHPAGLPAGETVIRGTHYFGDAWPVNFWNSARFEHLEADFAALREDGFNTIILVIPWGEFQPDVTHEGTFDEFAFVRLQTVLEAARGAGLHVALRIGYAGSFSHHPEFGSIDRAIAFLESGTVRQAYFAFLGRLRQEIGPHPHVIFAFLTWEDLSLPVLLGSEELRTRLAGSALMPDWRQYLTEHVSMDEARRTYGTAFVDLHQIPLPAPGGPQAKLVHDFWDWFLIHRLFKPASAGFARFSFEARADDDLVVDAQGRAEWVTHAKTYRMPGASFDTTYWAVFWGMKNRADRIPARQAITSLKTLLWRMESQTRRHHTFIDQFVFQDDTPGLGHLTRLEDGAINTFLQRAARIIARRTIGYALWTHRAYRWNMLYNAAFVRGLLGWECEGSVRLVDTGTGQELEMRAGASIAQHIPESRQGRALDYREFCIRATAHADSELRVECGEHSLLVRLPAGKIDQCHGFLATWGPPVTISLVLGHLQVERLVLSVHTEGAGLYTTEGTPTAHAGALRRFNATLARPRPWWKPWP